MNNKAGVPLYNQSAACSGKIRWLPRGWLLLGWLLLAAGFMVLSGQPARAQDAVQQTLDARLIKTVGTTPSVCAPEGNVYVDVAPGATVYICYTLINTGSVPLEPFALIDNYVEPASFNADVQPKIWLPLILQQVDAYVKPVNFDTVAWDKPQGLILEPGATLKPTLENGLIRAVTADASLTSLASWGLASADGAQTRQITSNPVTINLVTLGTHASLSVSASSGTATANCSSPSVALSAYQIPAYLCLTLSNASSITLTQHQIEIPGFGISFALTKTLGASGTVSATIRITNQDNGAMAPKLSATTMTSRAYITSTNQSGSLAVNTVSEPVVVTGPTTSVTLLKTINTTPDSCGASNALNNTTPGQLFYYCLVLINNAASLTYTEHVFTEPAVKLAGSFSEILPPGARISITNSYLQVNKGVTPFLGPITATQSLNSTMVYTASEPSLGYRAVASALSSVSVLTPTPTSTDAPTPTNTPIPFETPFSTPTATPIPPTPTATWTWTPSPTPTPSPTVLVISTPGGAATPYPTLPGMLVGAQTNPYTPPLDPFAATATAQVQFGAATPVLDPFGATATAQAQFAFPTPVLDPFGATATAQTQSGFFTSPLDPFAATATTQAQFAFPTPVLDPFGATATAQAQSGFFTSPLDPSAAALTPQAQFAFPTPVLDPFGSTATAQAQFGFATPVLDPFGATATAQPQAQLIAPPSLDPLATTAALPPATVAPSVAASQSRSPATTPAAVAVLPPQSITVTATFTPPAPTTPTTPTTPTQRPIEPPTPGPTVDTRSFFVNVLDSIGASIALLWVLGGSVLFFVTAGVLAGLSFRSKERARFELEPDTQASEFTMQPQTGPAAEPSKDSGTAGRSDDHWPESLP